MVLFAMTIKCMVSKMIKRMAVMYIFVIKRPETYEYPIYITAMRLIILLTIHLTIEMVQIGHIDRSPG